MTRPLPPLALALHQTPARTKGAPLAVGARSLRAILGRLLDRGYRFLRVEEVEPGGLPLGYALLTVDDGYASNRDVLAPLARELGIPWGVFVLVGAPGGRNDWDLRGVSPRERHLREEEIRGLAGEGVSIGSHGMTHRDFTRLNDAALAAELADSKAWLERTTGRRVDALSYPWGRVNRRVAEAARVAGYRRCFGLRGLGDFCIARTALYSPDQIPGVFEATALLAPRAGRVLRDSAGALGGWLVARALAALGRAHA